MKLPLIGGLATKSTSRSDVPTHNCLTYIFIFRDFIAICHNCVVTYRYTGDYKRCSIMAVESTAIYLSLYNTHIISLLRRFVWVRV